MVANQNMICVVPSGSCACLTYPNSVADKFSVHHGLVAHIGRSKRQLHVVASDSSVVCRQFRKKALLDARIHRWGSEVVTAEAEFEDQQSVVSHSSAENAYSCQGGAHFPLGA